jgi:hypothetical protein
VLIYCCPLHVRPLQDTTKNYHAEAAIQQLQQLIQLPWQSASLVMCHNTTSVQISRKGRVLVQTEKSKQAAVGKQDGISSSTSSGISSSSSSTPLKRGLAPVSGADGPILSTSSPAPAAAAAAASDGTAPAMYLQDDRVKAQPINGSVPDAFLQKIGLQTSDGRIKANMQVGWPRGLVIAVTWGHVCCSSSPKASLDGNKQAQMLPDDQGGLGQLVEWDWWSLVNIDQLWRVPLLLSGMESHIAQRKTSMPLLMVRQLKGIGPASLLPPPPLLRLPLTLRVHIAAAAAAAAAVSRPSSHRSMSS